MTLVTPSTGTDTFVPPALPVPSAIFPELAGLSVNDFPLDIVLSTVPKAEVDQPVDFFDRSGRRLGSFLDETVFKLQCGAFEMAQRVPTRAIGNRLAAAPEAGDKGKAAQSIYKLGCLFWEAGSWNKAEEMWVLGAKLFIGDRHYGALWDDEGQDGVVSALVEAKIVCEIGRGSDDPSVRDMLYHGSHWLTSGFIGGGKYGSVFKILGQPRSMKIHKSSIREDLDMDGVCSVETIFTREEKIENIGKEVEALRRVSAAGLRAARIFAAYETLYVRELIQGPTLHGLIRPRYGLSKGDIMDAWRKYQVYIDALRNAHLLKDQAVWKNVVYDLREREWVLIDP